MLEFIILAILGLKPDWQPQTCERTFASDQNREHCEADRDEGIAWARELAAYIQTEAERQEIDPLVMVAVGYVESRLEAGDVCRRTIDGDRIVSREVLGDDGRERIVVRHRSNPEETSTVTVTVLDEENNGDLYVDKCSAGEMGLFQLIPGEAKAGDVVPSTGEELSRDPAERRLRVLEPIVNVSLGAVALAESREYACEVVDEDDRDICEQGWTNWVATFNTGRREGEKFDHYTRLVSAAYRKALDYACAQMPEIDLCAPVEPPEVVEEDQSSDPTSTP